MLLAESCADDSCADVCTGYFPTHTLTEDYALGMEMRRKGWRGMYVEDELVRGSAPNKVRAAFGQRSRWCKVRPSSSVRDESDTPGCSLCCKYKFLLLSAALSAAGKHEVSAVVCHPLYCRAKALPCPTALLSAKLLKLRQCFTLTAIPSAVSFCLMSSKPK